MGSSGGSGISLRGAVSERRRPWWLAAFVATILGTGALVGVPSAAIAQVSERVAPGDAEPSPVSPGGNGDDAMAVVAQYEQAFAEVDCDLMTQVTTAAFRSRVGFTDCKTFGQLAEGRAEVVESIELTPVSAGALGRGALAALVHMEMYSFLDEDNEPVTEAVRHDSDYRYHFIRSDGAWKIDEVHDVTGGRIEGEVTDDEQHAVAEMMADWRLAYSTGDCDAAQASTTAGFRQGMGWADCAAFTQSMADQNAYCPMDVHQEDIRFHTAVDPHVGEILIDVVQVCTLDIDESGAPLDPPFQSGVPYRYHLVESDGGWLIAEGDDRAAAEDVPSNTNERAAVDAMRAYNESWFTSDCAAYLTTSGPGLRAALDVQDCGEFATASADYGTRFLNYALTPTDIERPSATLMEIKSHETYDAVYDVDGQPMDPPFPFDEYWVYTVTLQNGAWVITDIVPLL